MAHAHILKAVEYRIYGHPNLFIRPVWANPDTCQESLDAPYQTPHFGLSSVALHIRIEPMMDRLELLLVAAPRYYQTLAEHTATNRELKATTQVFADLQRSMPDQLPTVGQRCAAWCEHYGMPGVLLPRASEDGHDERYWLARNVRVTVDRHVQRWEARARRECMPEAWMVDALGEMTEGAS